MSFDSPHLVVDKLFEIEADLAVRQNMLEAAARSWFLAKRHRSKAAAVQFLSAEGTVAERNALADRETAVDGVEHEAEYEAVKAVVNVLVTRASILQSVLKVQAR